MSHSVTCHHEALTERQRAVVLEVSRGVPLKAIAAELGISFKTVEYYWSAAQRRVGRRGIAQMTRWAARWVRRPRVKSWRSKEWRVSESAWQRLFAHAVSSAQEYNADLRGLLNRTETKGMEAKGC